MSDDKIVKGPTSTPIKDSRVKVPDTVGGGGELAKKVKEFNKKKEDVFDTMKKKGY